MLLLLLHKQMVFQSHNFFLETEFFSLIKWTKHQTVFCVLNKYTQNKLEFQSSQGIEAVLFDGKKKLFSIDRNIKW